MYKKLKYARVCVYVIKKKVKSNIADKVEQCFSVSHHDATFKFKQSS